MPYSVANSTGNWTGSVSINSINTQTIDAIKNKVKVSATDAAMAAEKSLGNGSRIRAVSITPVRGYLVYTILGTDSSNNIHTLFIDVGNGNILADQQIGHSNAFFIVDGPWGAAAPRRRLGKGVAFPMSEIMRITDSWLKSSCQKSYNHSLLTKKAPGEQEKECRSSAY